MTSTTTIVFVAIGNYNFCKGRFGIPFCNCPHANKHHFYIDWAQATASIPSRDETQEPTSGQFNNWTTPLSPRMWRMNNRLLEVCGHDSVSMRKGQSKLMGSIHCTQISFILITINQSHLLLLSDHYSANPLVDLKTHHGTDAIVLFLCHDSHNPLCL